MTDLQSSSKVASFSVFGSNPTYSVGALRNIELYASLMPDYHCHFFLGKSVPRDLRANIIAAGGTYTDIGLREDWSAALWRFEALRSPNHSHFLFRDTDSRLGKRERDAVRAWEDSGQAFHVMRDHPAHGAVMLAGMWGCTQEGASLIRRHLPPLSRLRPSGDYHEHYDQGWLEQYVWPLARDRAVVHASHWKEVFGPTVPFPNDYDDEAFVAEAIDDLGNLRYPDHHNLADICSRCSCISDCKTGVGFRKRR